MLKKFMRISAVMVAVILILIIFTICYIQNLKSNISDNLLRLHIVGASDSEYDQTLKICVRDRIIKDFSSEFSVCLSADEAAETAVALKSEIEKSANDELRSRGCEDIAVSAVEKCHFPTKTYGSIALPGGEYTALNIRIGEAKGKNWWCVMYPPLCVTDKSVVMSETSAKMLKSSLSEEEYRLICGSDEPEIKIKFRIAEMIGEYFK